MFDNTLDDQEQPESVFPGWYPDPVGQAGERFWNGRRWTTQLKASGSSSSLLITETDPGEPSVVDGLLDLTLGEITVLADEASLPIDGISIVPDDTDIVSGDTVPDETDTMPDTLGTAAAAPDRPEPSPSALFARAETPSMEGAPSGDDEPQPPLLTSRTVTIPVAPSRPADARAGRGVSRWWLGLVVLAVGCAGLGVGYVVGSVLQDEPTGGSQSGLGQPAVSSSAEVEALERRLETSNGQLAAATGALDLLDAELVESDVALDAMTDERDGLLAHNQLLLTWFAPEVIERGQTEWDAEVARVCLLVADGTTLAPDLVVYTPSMELIGTESGLLLAIENCRSG